MRYVAVDLETVGLKPYGGIIWMLSITENKKTKVYHDCYGMKKCPSEIKKILEDKAICKIIQSSQFDVPYIELIWGIKIRNVWDTDLCETVIQGIKPNIKRKNIDPDSADGKFMAAHGTALHYLLPRYGCPKPDKSVRENFIDRPLGKQFIKKEINYAEDDTKYLPKIQKAQEYLLTRDGLLEVALLENKVSERYHDMKARGIGFDQKIWKQVAEEQLKEYKRRMAKLPPQVDNWNSEKQVKSYFRSKGILIETYDDLDKVYLQTRNKTLGDFIATRELSKAVSSYGFNWFEDGYIDGDGRIRCSFTQIINTGRNACSDPNLQQLPGSGNNDPMRLRVLELVTGGKKKMPQHRRAFVPKPGHVFVIGDFSGQEIGIMAAASEEELWINALLRGEDVHALTASVIDPVGWGQATEKGCTFPKKCKCVGHKKLREPAKINNFMLAYGGGPQKFADFVGTDLITASAYVGAHKRVIPRLTRYLEANGRDAMATGVSFSADPYRRRRLLKGEEAWQIKNQGKNNPIQSAGANMLKLAMANLPWKYAVVLVIHDEVICEVPKALAKECSKVLQTVMEQSADYITGIKGLIKVKPKIAMNIMKD
jgi:DNA polymerase I-like protein with 3'-5' exonuclease and polymerase domains